MLSGVVQREASVLSFNDTFVVTAVMVLASMPLVLLLGKPGDAKVAVDAH
jgi:DHA2 family multidrug resistance protein